MRRAHNRRSINPGDRFGMLTVLHELRQVSPYRFFKLRCDCGTVFTLKLIYFTRTSAPTRSCGCIKGENNKTHGMTYSPTYRIWAHVKQRCVNPTDASYPNYGGRGIRICKRWRDKFENFLADMGERPSSNHEITRRDNDGDYKPGNCSWSTDARLQNINRRAMGKTSKYRGVDLHRGRWRARFNVKDKDSRHLGYFDTEEEAARAHDAVARLHKGFILNFPN